MDLYALVKRLETAEAVDSAAEVLTAAVRRAVRPGRLKDLLSGTWLGHSLHPVLTDFPLGHG